MRRRNDGGSGVLLILWESEREAVVFLSEPWWAMIIANREERS